MNLITLKDSENGIDSSENFYLREACSKASEIILIDKDNGWPEIREELPEQVLVCIYFGTQKPELQNCTPINNLIEKNMLFQFCAGTGKEMADSLIAIHALHFVELSKIKKPPLIIISEDKGYKHLLEAIRGKGRVAIQLIGKRGFSLLELLYQARLRYNSHQEETEKKTSNINDWSCDEVCKWISTFNDLAIYADIFKENAITGSDLMELSEENIYNHLKITKLGHMKKISREIKSLKQD